MTRHNAIRIGAGRSARATNGKLICGRQARRDGQAEMIEDGDRFTFAAQPLTPAQAAPADAEAAAGEKNNRAQGPQWRGKRQIADPTRPHASLPLLGPAALW